MLLLALFLSIFPIAHLLAEKPAVETRFKADFYERDLQKNVVYARGNAWLQKENLEVWANEIEIDFSKNIAVATGDVHIIDGKLEAWARHATKYLNTEEALLEEASLSSGKLVISGAVIRKVTNRKFEITEGSYTNCNNDLVKGPELATCEYDWKLYGKYFTIEMEGYAHIYDAIGYLRKVPVLYSPYFIAPVKFERQSGFLLPSFAFTQNVGTGFVLPYFWAIGPWQDLTLTPSYYSRTGYHLAFDYRYVYSNNTSGNAKLFILQRRFSDDRNNPRPDDPNKGRLLGVAGEWAVNIHNIYHFGGRSHSRQALKFVSDPFYTAEYGGDVGANDGTPSLRSQISFTHPSDHYLFTAEALHHQSLVVTKDRGVDRGSVTKLPSINFSRATTSFLDKYLSFEFDTNFTNYFRPGRGFDSVPTNIDTNAIEHQDTNPDFHEGNYIRTGRRLIVEPRLVANVPMPPGFQFQPLIRANTILYHFDYPNSSFVHRETAQVELPASIYLSKRFKTSIEGLEQVNHVIQPRVVYGASIYQREPESHPFFTTGQTTRINQSAGLSNPRFDILDITRDFEFFRFELINRFRRKSASGEIERFLLLQISEQYNSKTLPNDPIFSRRLGPIEVLSEFYLGNFTAQLQAQYQLEKSFRNVPGGQIPVRESNWSFSLDYFNPLSKDRFNLGSRLSYRANPDLSDQVAYLNWHKTLPIFFDVGGSLEYTFKTNEFRGYSLSLIFAAKPRSCWTFITNFGRNARKEPFANFSFKLDFGSPV